MVLSAAPARRFSLTVRSNTADLRAFDALRDDVPAGVAASAPDFVVPMGGSPGCSAFGPSAASFGAGLGGPHFFGGRATCGGEESREGEAETADGEEGASTPFQHPFMPR